MSRITTLVAALLMLASSVAAHAGSVGSLGDCRMRLRERETMIGVRFVMHTPNAGRDWRFKVLDEGRRVFRRVYTTDADGDFVARTAIRRRPGYRRYEGRATEIATGVVCRIVIRT